MCDINLYRLRIGIFTMPSIRIHKFKPFKKSKYKADSYRLMCRLLILLSLISYSLCESERVSERKIFIECRLPQSTSKFKIPVKSDVNFYARYTYGNRKNQGVKLCHWNAGNAFLKNKINSVESVISKFSPHIIGISEANLLKCHDQREVQIPDYELFTSLTMDNPNLEYSRIAVYKHSSIISKVRSDLMSDLFSSVWLECGLPNKKSSLFVICTGSGSY